MVKHIKFSIIILFTLFLVINCKEKEKLIRVKLSESKYYAKGFYESEKYIWGYDENVLIKGKFNKLDTIMSSYGKTRFRILDSLNYSYGGFSINFYQYTSITKTFLEKKYYIPTFSGIEERLTDQRDAYLGSIRYHRCKNDSTKWESKIDIKYEKSDVDIKDNKHPYYYREEVLESCY